MGLGARSIEYNDWKSLGEEYSDSYWVNASMFCDVESIHCYNPKECSIYNEVYGENGRSDVSKIDIKVFKG